MSSQTDNVHTPFKCINMVVQIWPCWKVVKGQRMIIIWGNLVDSESWMLYFITIYTSNFLGLQREDFLNVLSIIRKLHQKHIFTHLQIMTNKKY